VFGSKTGSAATRIHLFSALGTAEKFFDRLHRPLTRSGEDWSLLGAVPATQFPAQILINWPAKHAEENLSRNLFQQKFTRLVHLELLMSLLSPRRWMVYGCMSSRLT
jgi:hypothetical protein